MKQIHSIGGISPPEKPTGTTRLILWACVAGFTACLNKPTLVSLDPDYGYVDGCIEVIIQGHDLGEEASVTVAGNPVESLTPASEDDALEEWAQDVGFKYTGVIGPAPNGAPGFVDVEMKVGDDVLTMKEGFYYRSCPAAIQIDGLVLPGDGYGEVESGQSIAFVGCNLAGNVRFMARPDPADLGGGSTSAASRLVGPAPITLPVTGATGDTGTVAPPTGDTGDTVVAPPTGDTGDTVVAPPTGDTGTATTGTTGDTGGGGPTTGTTFDACALYGATEAAVAPLQSDCSTAQAHVEIPALQPGYYDVWIDTPDGSYTWKADYYYHTADSGIDCAPLTIHVGGAK